MPYAPSEEDSIASHVKSVLEKLIFRDIDDVDSAVNALSALITATNDIIPQQHYSVITELQELLQSGFEVYFHSNENSILCKTYYDSNIQEQRHVYVSQNFYDTEEDKIIEAKNEYQLIVIRVIQSKLEQLKALSPQQRQAFVESEMARHKAAIIASLLEAADHLNSHAILSEVGRRLGQVGNNLHFFRNRTAQDIYLQIQELNRIVKLIGRLMHLFTLNIVINAFQDTPILPLMSMLSGMQALISLILGPLEEEQGEGVHNHNNDLDLVITPR